MDTGQQLNDISLKLGILIGKQESTETMIATHIEKQDAINEKHHEKIDKLEGLRNKVVGYGLGIAGVSGTVTHAIGKFFSSSGQ